MLPLEKRELSRPEESQGVATGPLGGCYGGGGGSVVDLGRKSSSEAGPGMLRAHFDGGVFSVGEAFTQRLGGSRGFGLEGGME